MRGGSVSKTQKIEFYCQVSQHFCRSLKGLGNEPYRGSNPRLPAQQTGALPTEIARVWLN